MIENSMYGAKGSYADIHKSFPIRYGFGRGREFLKRILTFCTKYKEMNVCHSDIQKHVSYKKWFT